MTPYSNDEMTYDEASGQYIVTEKALEAAGIFLRARLSRSPVINATSVINGLCRTATRHVYAFIHSHHSAAAKDVDCYIAHREDLRSTMRDALVEQLKFIYTVGDWTLSPEKEKRADYISAMCKEILLNAGLLYTGG